MFSKIPTNENKNVKESLDWRLINEVNFFFTFVFCAMIHINEIIRSLNIHKHKQLFNVHGLFLYITLADTIYYFFL